MKNISQRTLEYNIELVKWENPKDQNLFSLVTVHSLLIDKNPKFIELKQLISDYNESLTKNSVQRPQLKRAYIEKLYNMLCQATKIYHAENQLEFLNKIYTWAFSGNDQQFPQNDFDINENFRDPKRPTTASTKTRPYSAHTSKARPPSGYQLPASKNMVEKKIIPEQVMERYPNVDFTRLNYGQKQFFIGNRTLHPEEQKPKIKLKEFHRKVFYDEIEDKDYEEFIQDKKEEAKQQVLKQIPIEQEVPLQEQKGDENQNVDGEVVEGEGGQPVEGEEVNIDDLVGEDEDVPEEEAEIIDKLRPRVAVYGNGIKQPTRTNKVDLQRGIHNEFVQRNNNLTKNVDQKQYDQFMQQWGMNKSRNKMQMKRRAQSARMVTKRVGLPRKTQKTEERVSETIHYVNLEGVKPAQSKLGRPKTAFTSQSLRKKGEIIKDTFTTGKLSRHIGQFEKNENGVEKKFTVYPANPKKKTFEEILKEAQKKVNLEAEEDTQAIKSKLIQNRIAITANRVAKSLTYDERMQEQEEFVGLITGAGMPKNPFFKVAKKKKKKKKK